MWLICDLKCIWLNPKVMVHGWQDQPFHARKQTDHSKSHQTPMTLIGFVGPLSSIRPGLPARSADGRVEAFTPDEEVWDWGQDPAVWIPTLSVGLWWHWSFWFTHGSADARSGIVETKKCFNITRIYWFWTIVTARCNPFTRWCEAEERLISRTLSPIGFPKAKDCMLIYIYFFFYILFKI